MWAVAAITGRILREETLVLFPQRLRNPRPRCSLAAGTPRIAFELLGGLHDVKPPDGISARELGRRSSQAAESSLPASSPSGGRPYGRSQQSPKSPEARVPTCPLSSPSSSVRARSPTTWRSARSATPHQSGTCLIHNGEGAGRPSTHRSRSVRAVGGSSTQSDGAAWAWPPSMPS